MICIGRSNYFRFNHPEEAERMKTILPPHSSRISSAPMTTAASLFSPAAGMLGGEPPGKKEKGSLETDVPSMTKRTPH